MHPLIFIPTILTAFDCTIFEQRLHNIENKVAYHAERFEYQVSQRAYREYLRHYDFLKGNCNYTEDKKEIDGIIEKLRRSREAIR